MRQASPFLIMALYKIKNNLNGEISDNEIITSSINNICTFLFTSLDNLERKFELGEVLIGLVKICNNNYQQMFTKILKNKK